MKVKMLTLARGPEFNADPGQVVDVAEDLAIALVYAGSAEEVKDAKPAPVAAPPAPPKEERARKRR